MRQKLTDISIRQLPHPSSGNQKVWDTLTPGFGIRLTKGTKSFIVMTGKERKLTTLGKWPDLTLKDARIQAKAIQLRPVAKNTPTGYSEALEMYLADCRTRLRARTVEEYERPLRAHAVSQLPDIVPDTITDPHHIMAFKVFYNWLLRRELVDRNPFEYKKIVTVTRDRVLTDDEVAAIWAYHHPPYSDIIKLLLLTGQRRNQIWQLQPEWCDDGVITFPASIMKGKKLHQIPIGSLAEQYLHAPFSFNSWSKAKARMDKEIGVHDWRLHDLRRFFSTSMARLGTPLHVTEQILDHRSEVSGVAAVYNRYNFMAEMRTAVESYETFIRDIVS